MRKIVLLATVAALSGCAYPNPQHVAQLNGLVGKSETDLLRNYGVPNRTFESNGHKFLAYDMNRIETIPGGFGPGPWGPYGYGWGGWGGWRGGWDGPEIIQRDCETTFELVSGAVKSYTLRGNAC
jgi:hypothetical protein